MLVAINFHYIRESYEQKYPSIFGLTPLAFRNQLEVLSKIGEFVSAKDILDHCLSDKKLPTKSILITFDDGLKEQIEWAKPILDNLGIPAIFYANAINSAEKVVSTVHKIHLLRSNFSLEYLKDMLIGKSSLLNNEEKQKAEKHYNYDQKETAHFKYYINLKLTPTEQRLHIDKLFSLLFSQEEKIAEKLYMQSYDIQKLAKIDEIGSHGYEHYPLGQISSELLLESFIKSDEYFKKTIGYKPFSISYPYGSYQACIGEVNKTAKKFDFIFGFTMERAGNYLPKDNSLMMARFDCNDVPGGKNYEKDQSLFFNQIKNRQWKF